MSSSPFLIAGLDEVGRGPLAGPVTAACVVFPPGYRNARITDSKKLSERAREQLFPEICRMALAFSVVSVGARRIEALNIREASRLAMKLAAERVQRSLAASQPQAVLWLMIDGNVPLATVLPQETIIKGDSKILQIAAASILAKVTRDRMMVALDQRFTIYGFAKHKGYPTHDHQAALAAHGPSRLHRRTFAGVRELLHLPA